jgi:hypothetical protein
LFSASGAVSEWGAGGSGPEITMRPMNARPSLAPRAGGAQAGSVNYLVGSHPDQWRIGVPLFGKIIYSDVYSGIDLIYSGSQNQLRYDFVVAPGASWRSIRLEFTGAKAIEIDKNGDLKLQISWGWLRHRRPRVYQQVATGRRNVAGHFVLKGKRQVGFELGAYDPGLPLVIDPTLVYSSYLGGSAADYGYAVAVDNSGSAYTVGETWSANFPLLNPMQSVQAGDTDIFVTKWNAAGSGILYSTYIGGSNRDVPLSIAVDAAGNAYITGFTYSADFPTTKSALRTVFSGQSKAFVCKLNPSGNGLVYSTFLGGSGSDYASGIAVDSTGQAYVSGYTASVDFPVSSNAFQSLYGGGDFDGFFARLNAAGSQLVYATYLGGIGDDTAFAVALDPAGNIYLTGQTQSSNFPMVQAVQTTFSEGDAFVVKMNAASQVLYSTYLGGTGLSTGTGIAADAAGNAYVAGYTTAPDFPVSSSAYQASNHGSYDTFVAVLSADGSAILNATYFGGSGAENTSGIALDSSGDVFVAGSTNSTDLPLQAPVQASYGGGGDAFVAEFNNQLSSLLFSTYFGGAESETGAGIAVDSSGNAYLTGTTDSGGSTLSIPVTTGAFQTLWQGSLDAFLAKFSFSGVSAKELVWQNSTTRQVTANYYGGTTITGWNWLNAAGDPGWTVVAVADMNGDGVPDLIWQNDTTRQVTVNYYGGTGGATLIGWNWLNAAGNPGWTVVAAADMNGDGVPDLIWQNDTTRQVTVNYYGGTGGATLIGWNWLNAAGDPGWTVVAAADMNGDGVPDLIWQNDATCQVTVNYYGGAGGATLTGWNWLNAAGDPGWTVVGASDINGDGTPDLVWENNSTGQVTVNFYGGAQGATLEGWAWLNAAGNPGWHALVSP